MMNAEQKQQAIALVKAWGKTAYGMHADAMAALLQELVDAPEVLPATNPSQISSSAEPFGYFKAEPFGWTDCAETDDGAIALYTAPPAPSVPDGWIRAIDEAMVVHHIGIADRADSYEVARKKLNALLAINSDIARDCSEPPADVARDAERYRWLLKQAWFQQAADRFDLPDGGLQNRFEKCMDEFIDAAIERQGGE